MPVALAPVVPGGAVRQPPLAGAPPGADGERDVLAAGGAGEVAWRGRRRRRAAPPGPGPRLLRQAGQRAARQARRARLRVAGAACGLRPSGKWRRDLRGGRVRERRDDGQGWMAVPLVRSWGGLPISASAGPPARS